MIIFHSIKRKIEKSDPTSRVVLEMPYEDVSDLCHILWECRNRDMLKGDNEKFLQLEFQSLRHLMVDGQVCEPFEVCSLHDGLELMGWGDEKQGFKESEDVVHDLTKNPHDLPKPNVKVQVLVKHNGSTFNSITIHTGKKWIEPYGIAGLGEEFEILAWKEFKNIEVEEEVQEKEIEEHSIDLNPHKITSKNAKYTIYNIK